MHSKDADFMRHAIELARKSRPSPNPRVGAVVVKDHKIVGRGFHKAPGQAHAEVMALERAGEQARGATIYVTLEPCCHQGRTGPCSRAINAAGIKRVVVGMVDPDLQVNGQGIEQLRQNHEVAVGILEDECQELLAGYKHHRQTGRPLVHLKAAVTLDGFIATKTGDSKWITGQEARAHAHRMRSEHDAILVGIGTVLADDPTLTVRHCEGINPMRVVLDTNLKTPVDSNLVRTIKEAGLLIAHGPDAPTQKASQLQNSGVHLVQLPLEVNTGLSIESLITELEAMGVLSLFVEGGRQIHGSFVTARRADKFSIFIAPKIIGEGYRWISLPGIETIGDAIAAKDIQTQKFGDDILLSGRF